ncbi:MAG: chromosomal replication initiation protein DnaA, partial [Micrococcales bacterium]|nr:chromosomal replication initiation protein DnaA [Micrococcales bacterium]
MSPTDISEVWARTTQRLANDPGITARDLAFIRLAQPLGMLDQTMLVAVGNDFTKDVVETRIRDVIVTALSATLGREVRIAVTVDPTLAEAQPEVVEQPESRNVPTRPTPLVPDPNATRPEQSRPEQSRSEQSRSEQG